MNLSRRIEILENELSDQMIEVFIPGRDNILTNIDELMELYHEIIQSSRENREIQHSLVDQGILQATGANTSSSLVKLFVELVKAGDSY